MKRKNALTSIAALTALRSENETSGLAVLSTVMTVSDANRKRVQLLPDGIFRAKDGRPFDAPHWILDQTVADRLIQKVSARANDLHFDYEHQTLNSEKNGKEAPAAGWFRELEYVPGEGLFAIEPRWTTKAKRYIEDEEYRYVSAVFAYDGKTGEVTDLHHAALTNDPGLDGMKSLAAMKHFTPSSQPPESSGIQPQQEDSPMNEALKLLLATLGIEFEDKDLEDAAACKKLSKKANDAIAALKATAADSEDLTTQVAALKSTQVDPAKYVPIEVANELRTEIAALKSGGDEAAVTSLIETARSEGRLLASEVDWAKSLAEKHGFEALKSNIDGRPTIAALTRDGKGNKPGEDGKNTTKPDQDVELTADELAICKNCGVDPDDYRKVKGAS
ncbi:phage protease [Pseudidiomarina aestuarii]|uniref:phage protease n=1 Tax=Pseudidiomarina aestuarii TaxID=624146 RepID=UPI003A970DF2